MLTGAIVGRSALADTVVVDVVVFASGMGIDGLAAVAGVVGTTVAAVHGVGTETTVGAADDAATAGGVMITCASG
jgi:hypothetical protein